MKKVFLSIAVITIAFVTLAFAPVEKNNVLDDFETISEKDMEKERGHCIFRSTTHKNFTESCIIVYIKEPLKPLEPLEPRLRLALIKRY